MPSLLAHKIQDRLSKSSKSFRFAFSIIASLGALSAQSFFSPHIETLLYPTIALVTWFAGYRAGLLSLIICGAGANAFLEFHFSIQDSVRILVFFAFSFLLIRQLEDNKDAEKKLRSGERKFYTLFNLAAFPSILVKWPSGIVVDVNTQWTQLFGYDREEMIGKKTDDLKLYPDLNERTHLYEEVARHGKVRGLETTVVTKTGNLVNIANRVDLLEIEGQMYLLGTLEDITERKHYEQNLLESVQEQKEAQQRLQEALKTRDEFLSIASHELKTPITALKLQAQLQTRMLKKNIPEAFDKDRIIKLNEQAVNQINRLVRLVEGMLDVSRIRIGKLKLEKEDMDLSALVIDVLERMKPQFISSGCGEPVLKITGEVRGVWDSLRIEQVLMNLLTNAIRYGDHRPVTVAVENKERTVLLTVSDLGIGISDDFQAKIFNRFERAVNYNEVSGLGLGLFISRQIVEAHGGKIWVESELKRGSNFFVELPKNS